MRHPEGLGVGISGEPSIRYQQNPYDFPQIKVVGDNGMAPIKLKETKMGRLRRHLKEVIQPTWNFAGRIKDEQGHQQNALIGLASEAGELLDIGKKLWYHTEKPNGTWREKMLSEFGDIYYYLLKAQDVFGFTTKEILDYNRKKLASRHPELGEVSERFGKDHIKG